MGNLDHNTAQYEPSGSFEPLPPGKYLNHITASKFQPTRNNQGEMLVLEHTVIEPVEFAGRKFWTRLNLKNPSADAVQIARRELTAICSVIGLAFANNHEDLRFKKMVCTLAVDTPAGYNPSNKVTEYLTVTGDSASEAHKHLSGGAPGGGYVAPPPSAPTQPAQVHQGANPPPPAGNFSKSTPPWGKR